MGSGPLDWLSSGGAFFIELLGKGSDHGLISWGSRLLRGPSCHRCSSGYKSSWLSQHMEASNTGFFTSLDTQPQAGQVSMNRAPSPFPSAGRRLSLF